MKATLILALMTMLVPPKLQTYNGESEADAKARYAVIASAQSGLEDETLTLLLVTTSRHESAYVRSVHSGKRAGDEGRSHTIYQFMCGRSPDCVIPRTKLRVKDVVGVDLASTRRATTAAKIHLRFHLKRCNGAIRCVVRNYIGAPPGKLSKKLKRVVDARESTFYRLKAKVKKCRSTK